LNSSQLWAEANEDHSFSSQGEKQVWPDEAKAHDCPDLHQLKGFCQMMGSESDAIQVGSDKMCSRYSDHCASKHIKLSWMNY
jgi:hypothetical protein